jgi:endonuclease III
MQYFGCIFLSSYLLILFFTMAHKLLTKKHIQAIFCVFEQSNPHPQTELIYHNHFQLLIAVLLSAQATDISVNKATDELFKIVQTPEDILNIGEVQLITYIKSIGLYKSKARHIMATCRILVDVYSSQIPNSQETLESLPGVGRKTANVVRNVAFGECTMAVDTHIFRVSNRIGLADGKTPLSVEKQLLKNIPKHYMQHAHHWLILHGRYVCKARKPLCNTCCIQHVCLKINI